MATKEELQSKSKEELLELARERDVEGRSGMNKDELASALADDSSSEEGKSEGSEERLEAVKEEAGEAHADLVTEELDEKGPLHVQAPSERIMTGAVNEEQAKEQEKILKEADLPEGYVGDVTESGEPVDATTDVQKSAEDVIDFPPPPEPTEPKEEDYTVQNNGPFGSSITTDGRKNFGQKAVFYTDGLSGAADQNLERAYDLPEKLQSNDAEVRTAGDESESEAAQDNKSEEEKSEAEDVKGGSRQE